MARSTASPLGAVTALALAAALLAVAADGARAPSPAPAPGPAPASGSSSSAGGLSTDKLAANGLVDGHGLVDELAAVAINATAIAEASSSLPPSVRRVEPANARAYCMAKQRGERSAAAPLARVARRALAATGAPGAGRCSL